MELKANELRIGNWALNPNNNKLYEITAMDISDIQSKLKNRLPVILNQETLCGIKEFIRWDAFGDIKYGGYIPFPLFDGLKLMVRFFDGNFIFNVVKVNTKQCYFTTIKRCNLNINSVHQLQNLYFALTQTELEIRL